MTKFRFLFCLVLVFVLCGCNGARVVDNQYSAIGKSFTVSSDMEYVGEVPMTFLERCTGNGCSVISSGSARIVEDIFVRSEDKKVKEFVLIGFKRVTGRYYWPPFKQDKVSFADGEYVEFYDSLQADAVGDVYLSFLKDRGFTADSEKYYMRTLVKNATEKNRMYLVYVCSENMLPEEGRDNADVVSDVLRKKMSGRILAPTN